MIGRQVIRSGETLSAHLGGWLSAHCRHPHPLTTSYLLPHFTGSYFCTQSNLSWLWGNTNTPCKLSSPSYHLTQRGGESYFCTQPVSYLTLPKYQNKLANLKMYQPPTCITLRHEHVRRVYRRTMFLLQPCKLSEKCLGRLTTPTSKGGLCCFSWAVIKSP